MKMFKFLFVITILFSLSFTRIYDIKQNFFKGDATLLSTFGHSSKGVFTLEIKSISFQGVNQGQNTKEMLKRIGFIYKPVLSDNTADWETVSRSPGECFTDKLRDSLYFSFKSENSSIQTKEITHSSLYGLFFYHCENILKLPVSFEIQIEEYNLIGSTKHFLSVGEIPLIFIFLGLSFFFYLLFIIWIILLIKERENLFKIHYLMGILVFLKATTLLLEGIRLIDINFNGYSVIWSILYYIFATLKAFMLFVVILLIGSGWSFIKPYLNDLEKQLLLGILSLQVVSNVAMVIIEQTAEGASSWLFWRQILLWVDVICCCLVLPAIAWSIRNFKNSKDERSQKNAVRLGQFQQFYLVVIGYLYFTRIISLFIKDTLPFNYLWIPDLLSQLVSMFLFLFTGVRFRPMKENPYIHVNSEDEGDLEGEIDEEDVKDIPMNDETQQYIQEEEEEMRYDKK